MNKNDLTIRSCAISHFNKPRSWCNPCIALAHGREIDRIDLHRAFSRKCWERKTDAQGFVRINRWKAYVEAGLPKTPVQVTYWDKKLRAEYDTNLLVEYNCKWDNLNQRPKAISQPQFFETPFESPQLTLFDPYWLRSAIEIQSQRLHLFGL